MITERSKIIFKVLGAALLAIGLLFLAFNPSSQVTRAYPDREEVVFWHMWTGEWTEVVNRIVKRFNESQEEYEVVALPIPRSGADFKFLLSVAGKTPPDVMAQWRSVLPAWASQGVIMPFEDLMSPEELEAMKEMVYPVVWDIGSYDGKFYGLSVGLNIWALYYRPSHFVEVGLDPDRVFASMDELDAASEKLFRFDASGNILRIGFLPQHFHGWLPSFGGSLYDWESGEVTLRTPANLAALEWMQGYTHRYGLDRIIRFNSSLQSGTGGTMDWPFISGAYSIAFDGQWRVEQLARYAPNLDYRVMPVPPGGTEGLPQAGLVAATFMIIPEGAKNPRGAMEFIKFWSGIVDPDRAAEFYTWGGWLPISQEIAEAPAYRAYVGRYPQFQVFLDILPSPNLTILPPIVEQNYLMDRMNQMEQRVLRLSEEPEPALQGLMIELEREMSKRRERP